MISCPPKATIGKTHPKFSFEKIPMDYIDKTFFV